ncbi:hypothetical protein, partial [Plasmodium yoelii yoelii]
QNIILNFINILICNYINYF